MIELPLVAVVGNPNAGKSVLFNALTGARQKVGNYPGVTVERHVGRASLPDGSAIELVDLPGAYGLDPTSPDEEVTRDVLLGKQQGERLPQALLIVVDASNLDNHLRFALQLIDLGLPTVVALNMVDLAKRDGLELDAKRLEEQLGVPVIETVAVRKRGLDELRTTLGDLLATPTKIRAGDGPSHDPLLLQRRARDIAMASILSETPTRLITHRLDGVLLHPFIGPLILAAVLFVMFQAVFAWSAVPADALEAATIGLGQAIGDAMPSGVLRSLVVDGLFAGVGAVIVFLPQILILFLFILVLESTGYMVRAAFLMDRLMSHAGLSGRAFIPLLSSFACAVPGIMATRTIADPKDRLTTILVAPLMTCSARLPVYTLIIAAFIPERSLAPGIGLQGVVMFVLYLAGIVGALIAAVALRKTVVKGGGGAFMMELPKYQMPRLADVAIGLWQRAAIFLKRAGTIILLTTVILWALASFPQAGPGQKQSDVSIAGRIGDAIHVVVAPIGFNKDISLALLPAMAAREVAVAAIGTVYSLDAEDEGGLQTLEQRIAGRWSLATALAFLAWFVFAPQCISTIAVTRRETNGWKWPIFMVTYLFVLAYIAAGATYWTAVALGLG
ncbi:ferrous iron transporter B [Sphingomonas sp. LY29]|uniref:ferrous iron transporter B n=1 Tax=unclassified Sphingomonas TaxID=196159 RepID=UPI002ADECBC0|nr:MULTISPECIES: ferrous iron transporter B [unclassified Sphingomonas]MEA1072359.1 ferrous iron transporter B [Sphingomonas sp. LY160]WRP24973.1 ferrous iron transporter B [Sphingomonas sp. LY29]